MYKKSPAEQKRRQTSASF